MGQWVSLSLVEVSLSPWGPDCSVWGSELGLGGAALDHAKRGLMIDLNH